VHDKNTEIAINQDETCAHVVQLLKMKVNDKDVVCFAERKSDHCQAKQQ